MPKKIRLAYPVYPSTKHQTSIYETYNTIYGTSSLLKHTHATIPFDNLALDETCRNRLHVKRPTFSNLNRLIAQVISASTANIRFKSSFMTQLYDFGDELVPYSGLQYILASYAPYKQFTTKNDFELFQVALSTFVDLGTRVVKSGPERGFSINTALMFRCGNHLKTTAIRAFSDAMKVKVTSSSPSPGNFDWTINESAVPYIEGGDFPEIGTSVCTLDNNTSVTTLFERNIQKFDKMFAKKAFLHSFLADGHDEDELVEASDRV